MDRIFLHGLALDAVIGVHAHERDARQPLLLDLEFETDHRIAAASDALADTLDYAAISERIRAWAAKTRFELLETLLERMAAMLLAEFPCRALRIRVHKPMAAAAIGCADVGIELRREGAAA